MKSITEWNLLKSNMVPNVAPLMLEKLFKLEISCALNTKHVAVQRPSVQWRHLAVSQWELIVCLYPLTHPTQRLADRALPSLHNFNEIADL